MGMTAMAAQRISHFVSPDASKRGEHSAVDQAQQQEKLAFGVRRSAYRLVAAALTAAGTAGVGSSEALTTGAWAAGLGQPGTCRAANAASAASAASAMGGGNPEPKQQHSENDS